MHTFDRLQSQIVLHPWKRFSQVSFFSFVHNCSIYWGRKNGELRKLYYMWPFLDHKWFLVMGHISECFSLRSKAALMRKRRPWKHVACAIFSDQDFFGNFFLGTFSAFGTSTEFSTNLKSELILNFVLIIKVFICSKLRSLSSLRVPFSSLLVP